MATPALSPGACAGEFSPSTLLGSSPYFVMQKHPRVEARGFGLYSAMALPAGFRFYEESPACVLQHAMNKSLVRACCQCQRVVGHAGAQLRHLFAAANPEVLSDFDHLPSGTFPDSCFAPVIECPGGCGEVYCSQECQRVHLERSHRFLCVGPLSETHPLVAFKRLCLEQTEILLLAAEAICAVVTHAVENVCFPFLSGGPQRPADSSLCDGVSEAAERAALLHREHSRVRELVGENAREVRTEAERLFRVLLDFAHDRWEFLGEDEGGLAEASIAHERKDVLDLACRQLFSAFSGDGTAGLPEGNPAAQQPGAQIVASFFQQSSELLSRIAGLLEKTNSHVVVASPLNAFFRGWLANAPLAGHSRDVLAFLLREKEVAMIRALGEEEDESDEEDEMEETPELVERRRQRRDLLSSRFADVPCEALLPESTADEKAQDPTCGKGNRIRELVRPHAFPDVHGTGFYPSIGRMNHSCAPNVRLEFPYGTNRVALVTTRPVQPGEELCISYVDGIETMSAEEREDALEVFGFKCSCDVCYRPR
ncbi:putative histone lysine methyltransferase, SET [Toxoplasma gondii p89]|uniref:Putative histone lysine methyltransferase, SET n=1 Tax=Toxoplasma gondii p89 TaxID=943119 RepID=A0A086KUG8_TOXGO|nr:putative histone lysine methyltransferase, SET [Toxoplasma gondii p89]